MKTGPMAKIRIHFNDSCRFYGVVQALSTDITIISHNITMILTIEGKLNSVPVFGVKFSHCSDANGNIRLIISYTVEANSNYIGNYSVQELDVTGCDYINGLRYGATNGHHQIQISNMQTWPKTGILI